jgi:hypothetical protein
MVSAPGLARVVGRPFRPGQSGNPGGVPRRGQVLFEALISEFGAETLTAMQREYLKRAAELMRQAERAKGANASVRLTRCADQLISRVRDLQRDRQAATPAPSAFDQYLSDKAAAR